MTQFTKIATWNIDKQATYDDPITACLYGDLDLFHCTEPATHMTPWTRATATLTNAADKACYALYVTTHSHTYIRQATIHTRLFSERFIYNGRMYTFLFKGEYSHQTAILCVYAFQRAHKDHTTSSTFTAPKAKILDTSNKST